MVVLALLGIPMAFLNEVNDLTVLRLLSGADDGAFTAPQLHAQVMLFLDRYRSGTLVTQVFWGAWLLPPGRPGLQVRVPAQAVGNPAGRRG